MKIENLDLALSLKKRLDGIQKIKSTMGRAVNVLSDSGLKTVQFSEEDALEIEAGVFDETFQVMLNALDARKEQLIELLKNL